MICIYDKFATKDTVMNTNGLAVLDNICKKAEIKEVLNGEYGLSAIFLLDKETNKHSYIVEEAIIKLPDVYGQEVFRIVGVTKRSAGKEIEIYARHITFDMANLFIESVTITNGNGAAFLSAMFGAVTTSHEFTYSSDITYTNTCDYHFMSLYDALFTDQYCFLNMLSGEVSRRQYALSVNNTVGSNNGVKIQSRKNLQGFEIYTNMDNVTTRIYPFGDSGLTIPEKYINSAYITNYPTTKSKKVDFSDIKVDVENGITEAIAQQKLRDAVASMYSIQQVDIPKAEYTIDFVALAKTEEYKSYTLLENIGLGDVVGVYEENFGVNISVRVTERVYNVINGLLASITLSNIAKKTKPNLKKIEDKVKEVEDNQNNILQQANNYTNTTVANAMNTMSPKVYTGTTTPSSGLGSNGDVYIQY